MNRGSFPLRPSRPGQEIPATDRIRQFAERRLFHGSAGATGEDLFKLLVRILSAGAAHNNATKKIAGYR
jgi:hypothetical protein